MLKHPVLFTCIYLYFIFQDKNQPASIFTTSSSAQFFTIICHLAVHHPGSPVLDLSNSVHCVQPFYARCCSMRDDRWKGQGISLPGAHWLVCDSQPWLHTRISWRTLKIYPTTPTKTTPCNRGLGIGIFKAPRWFQCPVRVEISGSGDICSHQMC